MTLQRAPRTRSAFQADRAEVRARLEAIGRDLQAIVEDAKTPGTAAHAELSVRASSRLAEFIGRRAVDLKHIRAGEPHHTHPTRERADKTEDKVRVETVYANGRPDAVLHRWLWPVEQAWRRHVLTSDQAQAAQRFRRAFNDSQRMPSPTIYSDEPRGKSDPTNRNGLTPQNMVRQARALALAGGEAGFIWKRLEDELRAVAWALILEEPFPGNASPMSVIGLGRAIANIDTDRDARWFMFGELRLVCERLVSIYRIFDSQQPQRPRS